MNKAATTVLALAGSAALFLFGFTAGASTEVPSPQPAVTVTATPGVIGSAAAKVAKSVAPTKKPQPTIAGDDLVHIGDDVPAGTYRVAEKLTPGQNCYWKKSNDAEGSDIIDNAFPPGGRPEVQLKKGQWFVSHRCPVWEKQ